MSVFEISDGLALIFNSTVNVVMLILLWKWIIPQIRQIHTQTNSLAAKAEAGARALGVQEGLLLRVAAKNGASPEEIAAALITRARLAEDELDRSKKEKG